ncbi:hypothetical protein NFJ02_30g77580 [Pycnococcus provasolii]
MVTTRMRSVVVAELKLSEVLSEVLKGFSRAQGSDASRRRPHGRRARSGGKRGRRHGCDDVPPAVTTTTTGDPHRNNTPKTSAHSSGIEPPVLVGGESNPPLLRHGRLYLPRTGSSTPTEKRGGYGEAPLNDGDSCEPEFSGRSIANKAAP